MSKLRQLVRNPRSSHQFAQRSISQQRNAIQGIYPRVSRLGVTIRGPFSIVVDGSRRALFDTSSLAIVSFS